MTRVALSRRASFHALGAVLIVATAFAYPVVASDYTEEVSFRVFEYVALAQAWNLLAGYGGLVSLGSAAFIGVGAYATAEVTNHSSTPLGVAMVLSGALAACLAAALSPALFRLRGLYFTVASLAMAEALRLLMINIPNFGGAAGLFLLSDAPTTSQLYFISLGVAVAACVLISLIVRTRLALGLRAVREDEDVASEMGVVTSRTKLAAFALSAFVMGVVGGMQAAKLGVINPYGSFGLQWTIDIAVIVIIGGIGTRVGPVVGAVVYVLLAEMLSAYPELHVAITGVILIAVVRFAPSGIWGAALTASKWAAHRVRQVAAKPAATTT
jgi:branched-chain amino acid transport system permease protein